MSRRPTPPRGYKPDEEDDVPPLPDGFTLDQAAPAPPMPPVRSAPQQPAPPDGFAINPPAREPWYGTDRNVPKKQLPNPATLGAIVNAIDGDTASLTSGRNLRLWGVDAPELKQQGWNRQGLPVPIGRQSQGDLNRAFQRGGIDIGPPVSMSYGRPVAPLAVQGLDLGQQLTRQGSTLAAPEYLGSDPQRRADYMQAERLARLNRLGIHQNWFQPPEEYRKAPMPTPDRETYAKFWDVPTKWQGLRKDVEQELQRRVYDPSIPLEDIAAYALENGGTLDIESARKSREHYIKTKGAGGVGGIEYRDAPRVLTDSGDGATGAAIRGFGSGALAGGLDELGAVVDMVGLTPGRENLFNSDRRMADVWANNQAQNSAILGYDEQAHPYAEFGGQIAGGLTPFWATKATTAPRLFAAGAAYGGAEGFLGTDGDFGQRAIGAAVGIPVGGAFGAAGGKAIEAGVKYAPRLADRMGVKLPFRSPASPGGEMGGIPTAQDIPPRVRDIIDVGPPGPAPVPPRRQPLPTSYPGPAAGGRGRDWIDISQIPAPPAGFSINQPRTLGSLAMAADQGPSLSQSIRIPDYLDLGPVRPTRLSDPLTQQQIRNAANDVQPRDVLPIPSNEVGSVEEAAARNAGRYVQARAPNERGELTPRTIRAYGTGAEVQHRGPLDMIGWLRSQGGLRDQGGELRHMGIDNKGRSLDFAGQETRYGPLVNPQGMTLDDAAMRAWEAGYFPELRDRPDVNTFVEALRDTHNGTGRRRFLPDDGGEIERFYGAQSERYALQQQRFETGQPVYTDKSVPATEPQPLPPASAYEEWGSNAPDFAGNINLRKLESPQDIRRALDFTHRQMGGFDAATRGRVTWGETERLASELGMTPETLLSRRKGQAFSAEEALASRQILAKSGNEIVNLAKRIQGLETPGDDMLADFQEKLVRHIAIQEQVAGMTAEAGRALQQFRQVANSRAVRGDVLSAMVQAGGGRRRLQDVADVLIEAAESEPGKFNALVDKMAKPKWRDKAIELLYISKLSRPSTHVVNVVSNALTSLAQPIEHGVAGVIGKARQALPGANIDRITGSEVGARAFGLLQGFREGLPEMVRAFRTGEASDFITRIETRMQNALPGKAGHIARTPLRALMAEDELFKAMARRMEINGQAVRIAHREGLKGEAATKRIAELSANPTDDMLQQAMEYGRYLTFQTRLGDIGSGIQQAKQNSVVMTGLFPFIRTPINLVKFAAERSPAAPFMERWRADFKAGGARRDLALARMMVGLGAATSIYQAALDGHITGSRPLDPKKAQFMQADGWQPYSFRVGDKFYSYSRLDPFATTLGVAADLATKRDGMTERQLDDYAMQLTASMISNLTDKVWLSSASDLLQAINDWPRYGEGFVRNFAASTVVPALSTGIEQSVDPTSRDARSIPDAIQSRIPGLSSSMPAKRNVWGEPIVNEGGVGPDIMSPMWTSTAKNDPVNREMLSIGARFEPPDRYIRKDGHRVDLTPEQYERYAEMAGRGTRQRIEALMSQPGWSAMSPQARAKEVSEAAKAAKADAKEQLFGGPPKKAGGTMPTAPRKDSTPPLPPGFSIEGEAAGRNVYRDLQQAIPGVRFTSGFRNDPFQADMRRRGYKPAENSTHKAGSDLDMLPPPGKTLGWLSKQVRAYDPNARLLIHDGHLHASFPGYVGAPPLGGARAFGVRNPNAGAPPPPPGFTIVR